MKIAVFGASGKVGRQVVALALEHGHEIHIYVHKNNPFKDNPMIHIFKGDISDTETVANTIQGCDAVICTLGSWGRKNKSVVSTGMKSIIPAMQDAGIERIVTVTGAGAFWSKDKPGVLGKTGHFLIKLANPRILADGEKHLELLEASQLAWTCVRSPAMTNNKDVSYNLVLKFPALWATVSRKAVAESLLDLAESKEYLRQAPFIKR